MEYILGFYILIVLEIEFFFFIFKNMFVKMGMRYIMCVMYIIRLWIVIDFSNYRLEVGNFLILYIFILYLLNVLIICNLKIK